MQYFSMHCCCSGKHVYIKIQELEGEHGAEYAVFSIESGMMARSHGLSTFLSQCTPGGRTRSKGGGEGARLDTEQDGMWHCSVPARLHVPSSHVPAVDNPGPKYLIINFPLDSVSVRVPVLPVFFLVGRGLYTIHSQGKTFCLPVSVK